MTITFVNGAIVLWEKMYFVDNFNISRFGS